MPTTELGMELSGNVGDETFSVPTHSLIEQKGNQSTVYLALALTSLSLVSVIARILRSLVYFGFDRQMRTQ